MGKKRAGPSAAIAPAQGKKMTFGDSDDEDFVLPSAPAHASSPAGDDSADYSADDSDSDAAPEAVGMRAGAAVEKKRQEKAEMEREEKRQAAKLRAARVAEAKLKAGKTGKAGKEKRKRPEPASESEGGDSDESPEEARLRRRMEAAMAAGEGDSEMDDDEASDEEASDEEASDESDFDEEGEDDFDGLEDEDDEEEEEEEEEEENEDEEDEDEDEDDEDEDEAGLLSAPVPKALRARMDAMMAAMETRAMSSDPKFADEMVRRRAAGPVTEVPKLRSALKAKKGAAPPARGTKITFDADDLDLAPGVAPLSADLLAEADASLAANKAVSAARESEERRSRKRRRKNGNKGKRDAVSRQVNDRTTVHLLPPVLGSGAVMPPVVGPRERVASAGKNLKTFYTRAMRGSGQIPGRGIADGRKRLPQ